MFFLIIRRDAHPPTPRRDKSNKMQFLGLLHRLPVGVVIITSHIVKIERFHDMILVRRHALLNQLLQAPIQKSHHYLYDHTDSTCTTKDISFNILVYFIQYTCLLHTYTASCTVQGTSVRSTSMQIINFKMNA